MTGYTIKVESHQIEDGVQYMAWIVGNEFKAIIGTGEDLPSALDELALSVRVILDYRKTPGF